MGLETHHIEQALAEIRLSGFDPTRRSTKWDLVDPQSGTRLPPKVILWRACEISGESMRRGGGWPTNDILEEHGYSIVPKENVSFEEAEADLLGIPAEALKHMARRHSARPRHRIERVVSAIDRSPAVSAFVKVSANGKCDLCASPAPFSTRHGPYLECHHIQWLSEGGFDHIENVVALCPNCHRKMHFAANQVEVEKLSATAKRRAI